MREYLSFPFMFLVIQLSLFSFHIQPCLRPLLPRSPPSPRKRSSFLHQWSLGEMHEIIHSQESWFEVIRGIDHCYYFMLHKCSSICIHLPTVTTKKELGFYFLTIPKISAINIFVQVSLDMYKIGLLLPLFLFFRLEIQKRNFSVIEYMSLFTMYCQITLQSDGINE